MMFFECHVYIDIFRTPKRNISGHSPLISRHFYKEKTKNPFQDLNLLQPPNLQKPAVFKLQQIDVTEDRTPTPEPRGLSASNDKCVAPF